MFRLLVLCQAVAQFFFSQGKSKQQKKKVVLSIDYFEI